MTKFERREEVDPVTLKDRKAYIARMPWVTILKKPTTCTGWHGHSGGKRPCKNLAYYSYKHHKVPSNHKYTFKCHLGERETYCWVHLGSRGFYACHDEERRLNMWMRKNPLHWLKVEEHEDVISN